MSVTLFDHCVSKYGSLFSDRYDLDWICSAVDSCPSIYSALDSELNFFRVRKNINESHENLKSASTFSYPNEKFCTENGRLNLYGHPVFYCSDSILMALAETRPLDGETVFVSEWRVVRPSPVLIRSHVDHSKMLSPLVQRLKKSHQLPIKAIDVESGNFVNFDLNEYININNDIAKTIENESYPYPNSAIYAHLVMTLCNVDLIIYPSSLVNYFSNIVFRAAYVDEYLSLNKVYKVKIIKNNLYTYEAVLLEVGVLNAGQDINWSLPLSNDVSSFLEKIEKSSYTGTFNLKNNKKCKKLIARLENIKIKKIISSTPPHQIEVANSNFKEASELRKSGKYQDAIQLLTAAIKLAPYLCSFYLDRGSCFLHIEKYNDAEIDFLTVEKLLHINAQRYPLSVANDLLMKIYSNLGLANHHQNNLDRAISYFEKALGINPKDYLTLRNYGNCLMAASNFSMALTYYERALELDPKCEASINAKKIIHERLSLNSKQRT